MPELPEVTTTANKLNEILPGKRIVSVWTSYNSPYYYGKPSIKDPKYFKKFKKEIVGQKVESVTRVGKNVLINIEGPKTILIHMKMTGHLLYGNYAKKKNEWVATKEGPLKDKFNGYIRVVFEMSDGKYLTLSDVRKFAKVTLIPDGDVENFPDTKKLGIDALDLDFKIFKTLILQKPTSRIKNILMEQELIAGIGNIYSDEALWMSDIHPETTPKKLTDDEIKDLLKNIKKVLKLGIDFGGDSTSDYRQPDGTPGSFQKKHNVYRRKGEKCLKKGCNGTIIRKVVGGRSAHFCNTVREK